MIVLQGIESLLNFEVGQSVKFNKNNHGFEYDGAYDKRKDDIGQVVKLCIQEQGAFVGDYEGKLTGEILVRFDSRDRLIKVHYSHLTILW